ncbi:MAG: hypothetical protein ABIL62_12525, partial [Planctomycetota bacterium]
MLHSIFPPLRGKYYKQILSALSGSSEAGGKYYFLKGALKRWNLNFGSPTAFKEIRHLCAKKSNFSISPGDIQVTVSVFSCNGFLGSYMSIAELELEVFDEGIDPDGFC